MNPSDQEQQIEQPTEVNQEPTDVQINVEGGDKPQVREEKEVEGYGGYKPSYGGYYSGKYDYHSPYGHTRLYNRDFGLDNNKYGDFSSYRPRRMDGNYNPGRNYYNYKPLEFKKVDLSE